ncbi:MAG TPA: tryptophan--tRNA ligase [Eubacteriales bacterium]|nr:tryptophan--tRNA ligase [Eubacteriales bacterium]
MEEKKTIFSGVQPSGTPSIGNYLGAIKNMAAMQDGYRSIYCIVDMHAITVRQEPAELREKTMKLLALYLACGIDPTKSVIFVQSHVSAHAELAWVLNTLTYVGELNRMTQYKDKIARHSDNINAGLLNYPILMASDILLYNTDIVPVGQDQKQHLELSRTLAERFNSRYSPTFTVPEPFIPKVGAKIMSLSEPMKKMSKSDENENTFISMTDDEATIMRKLKRAVTDSDTEIKYASSKPGVSNLLTIYSLCEGVTIKQAEERFHGCGYGELKEKTAESVIKILKPIQQRQKEIMSDKEYMQIVLTEGAQKAENIARKTLSKVYRKIGFVSRT